MDLADGAMYVFLSLSRDKFKNTLGTTPRGL